MLTNYIVKFCQVLGCEGAGAAGQCDAPGARCGGHAAVGGIALVIAAPEPIVMQKYIEM